MSDKLPHKYSLIVYLLLTNGITWLCWIPGLIIGAQHNYIMPNFDTYAVLFETGFTNTQHLILALAFTFGVYGPLIAGLIATWMDSGRDGLVDLWRRISNWRVSWRWYVAAAIITVLLPAIPVAFFALTGVTPLSKATTTLPYILFVFIAQVFTSGLGEEPGWRGYLLPRIQARFTGTKHVWLLGLIWAVWHYPLVIFHTLPMIQNVMLAQMIITILVSLIIQTFSLIGMTFIYAWLYNHTRSVFLVIIFHALSNLFNLWLTTLLVDPQAVVILVALMPWLVVIALKLRLGKVHFPGQTVIVV